MREKIGALIQFLAVVIAFAMLFAGIGGAYNTFFKGVGDVAMWTTIFIGIAAVGLAIGIIGVIIGNLLKK